MKIRDYITRLSKYEPYFFYVFVLINLIPILTGSLFPTVDGPAHLYNSNLIIQLLKNPDSTINNFYMFNQSINPNWTGHLLLSLFTLLLPSFLAEKIILIIYLLGLPLGVRHLFNTLSIKDKYLIYLIFPFTYSYLFYYGFYNFNIGVVLLFFGLSYWLRYEGKRNIKNTLILLLFSTLLCFSHLFVFAIFLLVIFIVELRNFFTGRNKNSNNIINYMGKVGIQLIPLLPGMVLMIHYLVISQASDTSSTYLSINEIVRLLKDISPAKGINYGKANIITQWIFMSYIALIVYLIIQRLYSYKTKKRYEFRDNTWLSVSAAILVFIFIMPDSRGPAIGFVTHRLILFFFLFLTIWLASQKVNYVVKIFVLIIVSYVNIAFVVHNIQSTTLGKNMAEEIREAGKVIMPNSTVLPVTNSDNFIFKHISNYLGADEPLIILENYEASLDHFPLLWNKSKMPNLMFGDLTNEDICITWPSAENELMEIDYIFILESENYSIESTCYNRIKACISEYYEAAYDKPGGNIKVYKRNTMH